ncbi:MAG: metalloregulator ArsR/SmtB family transcription factor [Planctomycetota bacterium]|nr:metalloregulator ArsR/SmtB family transcription factor [Planctomycetota bacterium]
MAMLKQEQGVTEQDLDQLSSLFRLLSDKTRLSILLHLAEGERNVTNLCDELGLPQPTVSHHLGLLRMNNVVGNRRHGKQVFYALNGNENDGQNVMAFAVQNLAVQVTPRVK